MEVDVIELEIAKHVFQQHRPDRQSRRRRRLRRDQAVPYPANLPRCLVGLEACVGMLPSPITWFSPSRRREDHRCRRQRIHRLSCSTGKMKSPRAEIQDGIRPICHKTIEPLARDPTSHTGIFCKKVGSVPGAKVIAGYLSSVVRSCRTVFRAETKANGTTFRRIKPPATPGSALCLIARSLV